MTLKDAFHRLTIEQVERALAADATHGFPQDVFGLTRLVLRTLSALDPDCFRLDTSSAELPGIDEALDWRIAGMLELEQLRLTQFE